MPLIELEPPRTLPRGIGIGRLPLLASGSESNSQLTAGMSIVLVKPAGIWIQMLLSLPPASSSRTVVFGSSVSRLASTQPAEPAPTMM